MGILTVGLSRPGLDVDAGFAAVLLLPLLAVLPPLLLLPPLMVDDLVRETPLLEMFLVGAWLTPAPLDDIRFALVLAVVVDGPLLLQVVNLADLFTTGFLAVVVVVVVVLDGLPDSSREEELDL